uniref:Uncharacterized protein n=1 Tax=Arundo donax TaxID=35708 RepID=A0A0A8Z172_ARUDO
MSQISLQSTILCTERSPIRKQSQNDQF